jgi:three-Cys-motif partner protein
MPKSNTGQGYSQNTPVKQQALLYFMTLHTAVVSHIIHRWGQAEYYYIDTNAGTGTNPDGTPGSALIAYQCMCQAGLQPYGYLIEKDTLAANALMQHFAMATTMHVACADNHTVLRSSLFPQGRGWHMGLVYCDPNGVNDLPFEALVDFYANKRKETARLDVLIHLSATVLKRCQGAGLQKYTLPDLVQHIAKDHWFIREQNGRDQWTFLFGTNWDKWPTLNIRLDELVIKDKRSLGMYHIQKDAKGRAVFARLSATNATWSAGLTHTNGAFAFLGGHGDGQLTDPS